MVFEILLELISVHEQRLLFIFILKKIILQVGMFGPQERAWLARFCGCGNIL